MIKMIYDDMGLVWSDTLPLKALVFWPTWSRTHTKPGGGSLGHAVSSLFNKYRHHRFCHLSSILLHIVSSTWRDFPRTSFANSKCEVSASLSTSPSSS